MQSILLSTLSREKTNTNQFNQSIKTPYANHALMHHVPCPMDPSQYTSDQTSQSTSVHDLIIHFRTPIPVPHTINQLPKEMFNFAVHRYSSISSHLNKIKETPQPATPQAQAPTQHQSQN
jgi:hypothetical protein